MIQWIKNHKKLSIGIIILLSLFFIIIMPLILNMIYYLDAPFDFFNVGYDISSILNYYGAVLTFVGTVSLGIITVYQNYISQKKTDEVNKLTLQLQKKSMAMAEQNYEKEKLYITDKKIPKFELKNSFSNGHYMNLRAELKNVSDFIVSGIKSVSFEVFDESDTIVTTSEKVKSKAFSLSPGQETLIEFNNIALGSKNLVNVYGQEVYDSFKKFTMVWSFQCEDSYSNIHYYKAKLYIEDINKFDNVLWTVEKVG